LNKEEEEYENSPELKQKLIEFAHEKKKKQKEEKRINDYIQRLEKEKDMELLVRRKLELSKLKDQSQLLDQMISYKQNELSGIKEETEKRDINNLGFLERALKKGSALEQKINDGTITKQQRSLLAEACLLDNGAEGKKLRENTIEELKGKMKRENRERTLKTDSIIQELNKKRAEIIDKEEELIIKKATLQRLEDRGYDFLAEVELGNAPPMELIIKNLNIDKDEVIQNAYENSTFNIRDVSSRSYKILNNADGRLEMLRREIRRGENAIIAKEQYKHSLAPLNPISKRIASEILSYVLEELFKKITVYENWVEGLRSRKKYLAQKLKRANKEISRMYNRRVIYE